MSRKPSLSCWVAQDCAQDQPARGTADDSRSWSRGIQVAEGRPSWGPSRAIGVSGSVHQCRCSTRDRNHDCDGLCDSHGHPDIGAVARVPFCQDLLACQRRRPIAMHDGAQRSRFRSPDKPDGDRLEDTASLLDAVALVVVAIGLHEAHRLAKTRRAPLSSRSRSLTSFDDYDNTGLGDLVRGAPDREGPEAKRPREESRMLRQHG